MQQSVMVRSSGVRERERETYGSMLANHNQKHTSDLLGDREASRSGGKMSRMKLTASDALD